MSKIYDNIFLAHFKAKETALLWGSSGFGKSATVRDFAKRHGFRVVEKRTCYIDPMAVVLPHKGKDVVTFIPADWLKDLITTKEKTVLFLDEFNRPSCPQTFSLFTELLLDRSIDGLRISDSVLILAAANLSDEDTGVVDVPNAVMNRVTHLVHAPSSQECCLHMSTELARKVLPSCANSLLKVAAVPELELDACPRQVDAVCRLYETGILDINDLRTVARGRLGIEKAHILVTAIENEVMSRKIRKIPDSLTPKNMEAVHSAENEGNALEVIGLLIRTAETDKETVARYLVEYATPETCRAMVEHKFFEKHNGRLWIEYVYEKGKLSIKHKSTNPTTG